MYLCKPVYSSISQNKVADNNCLQKTQMILNASLINKKHWQCRRKCVFHVMKMLLILTSMNAYSLLLGYSVFFCKSVLLLELNIIKFKRNGLIVFNEAEPERDILKGNTAHMVLIFVSSLLSWLKHFFYWKNKEKLQTSHCLSCLKVCECILKF